MKTSSLFLSAAAVALLSVAVFVVASRAQSPQSSPSQQPAAATPPAAHHHTHPAPTNLKVLPKTLTGDQLDEIMDGWAAALGTHCETCHTADPKNIGPNGRPQLNFADDTKPEKSTARLMAKMVQDINENYVSMVENSGAPVTCGTCHRGHLGPEPFVAPKKDHDAQHPPQTPPPPTGEKHDEDR